MNTFVVPPTISDYRAYINDGIVTCTEFRKHPFYAGLISFIIDHRTPIFFEASYDYERSHFTQYFNFSLVRDEYSNTYISDLYYLHDFVHMVFTNPLRPRDIPFNEFAKLAIENEYTAANETEILTYYRVPELRGKTFPELILYDVLVRNRKKLPEIRSLFELRKSIIENTFVETFFLTSPETRKIVKFLKKFNKNNHVWCRLWYDQFPEIIGTPLKTQPVLSYSEYPAVLSSYEGRNDNDSYMKNIVFNTRILLEMLGQTYLPETFEECPSALKAIEGAVVMKEGAQHFFDTFINSKKGE